MFEISSIEGLPCPRSFCFFFFWSPPSVATDLPDLDAIGAEGVVDESDDAGADAGGAAADSEVDEIEEDDEVLEEEVEEAEEDDDATSWSADRPRMARKIG